MTQFSDPRDAHLARLSTQVNQLQLDVENLRRQQQQFDRYVALAQLLRLTLGFGWVRLILKK